MLLLLIIAPICFGHNSWPSSGCYQVIDVYSLCGNLCERDRCKYVSYPKFHTICVRR